MSDRLLRVAGLLTLAVVAVLGSWSWWRVADPSGPWAPPVVVGGVIDGYADDTVVVWTTTQGGLPVRVGPATVVTDVDVRGTIGSLRPGRFVVARGRAPGAGEPFVAETILTWGPGQR